jgi:hypothetical protein
MVYILVGSLIVGGLATYSIATLRALPTARSRTTRVEAVKSAMRMAMTLQRDFGPSGCYTNIASYTVNDLPVTVSCGSTVFYATGADRYGVISTANTDNVAGLQGKTGGSAFKKQIYGKTYLNAGLLSGTTADVSLNSTAYTSRYQSANSPLNRYRTNAVAAVTNCDDATIAASDAFSPTPTTHTLECASDPWWSLAGDDNGSGRVYPLLPQIPTYERTGPLATIGGCNVFYPGRYMTGGTLTLSGTNYFASGVYYFERPLVVAAGATVVFGEGKAAGCVFDTDAAFAASAPKAHEITGKGATLLLGKAATFTAGAGSKITFNRRVSSASSRGSEGQAIRTVSFGVDTAAVQIPADNVKLSDGTLQLASAHSVKIGTSNKMASYTATTLSPTNTAVQLDLGAGSKVSIDGYVFTPHAKVVVNNATASASYTLLLLGGLAAANVQLNVGVAPSVATNWYVGTKSEVIQRRFDLTATALVGGHNVVSRSSFELNEKNYAINYWTVDA